MSGTNYIASNWRVPENSNSSKNDNYSLSFDPSSDYLTFPSGGDLFGNNEKFSFSFWCKVETMAAFKVFFDFSPNNFGLLALRTLNTSTIELLKSGSSLGTHTFSDTTDFHHFCIVYDKINIKLFIDTVEVISSAQTNMGNFTGLDLYLGNGYFLTSGIDAIFSEASIFNYDLSSPQISTLYGNGTSGAGNPMSLKPTPIAYYPLGDNSSGNPVTQPNVSVDDASVFDFDPSVPNYIDCGTLPYFETAQTSFSISFWFNQNAVGGQAFSIGNRVYFIIQSNRIQCWNIGPTTGRADTTGDTYSIGTWFHFMCTYDGTGATDTDKFKVWINGVPNTLNFVTSPPVSTLGTSARTTIASNFNNSSSANIKMSNVAIWSTDESAEVSNIYNDGVPATSYTNTPLAWYKLDQSANWEADTSGNWQIPDAVSAYPQSFNFVRKTSAVNGRAYLGSGSLTFNDKISASIWVRVDLSAANNYQLLFAQTDGTNNSWSIGLNSGNEIWYRIWNADGSLNQDTNFSGTDIKDGKWHHVVLVYDGTSNANGIKLFLDGEPEAQLTASSTGIDAQPLKIALANSSLPTQNSPAFNVGLANAQVWDTNLGDAEIEALYNNGTPLTTAIQSANLKGWWKLDDTALFDNTNWSIENQVNPSNYNSALDFDGGADVVTVPSISFDMTNNLTLSCWINLGTPTTWDWLCTRGGSGGTSSALNWRFSSGGALFSTYNGSSINAGVGFTTGGTTWHHLAITFNYSNGDVTIYKDGQQAGNILTFASGYPTAILQCIGAATNAGANSINAKISNFAIWESIQDISELYNNGTPATSYTSTPAAWWKLDNLTTGLQDNGSGGNNATNNGTTVANTFVNTESGTSADMTEQSLVNNNVSTLNGESANMTSGNLVLSDLTRNLPYENYSLNFDSGSSEDIDLGSISTLNNASTYTLSMWVNPSVLSGLQFLFAIVTSTTERLFINLNNAIPNVGMANGTNSAESFNSAPLTVDTWHHLAVVFDGTQTGADRLTFYLNGVAETTTVTTWDSSTPTFASNGFLAKYGQIALYYFSGKIGNFSIFSDALSTTEVLKLYANGLPQDLTNFTPQPAHWWTLGKESFWNGSEWIVRDMIGSNDGTSANMAVNDLVGDAPRSEANGTGTNMDIPTNLVGNAGFSDKNAYSINMGPSARVTDTP